MPSTQRSPSCTAKTTDMIATTIQLKDVENLEQVFARLEPTSNGFHVVPIWALPEWLIVLRQLAKQNEG